MMNRTCILAAGLVCGAALLSAQTQAGVTSFQQAQSLGEPLGPIGGGRGGRGVAGNTVPIPRSETGRPFSATATTQSVQALIDGTHVRQTTTAMQYRDAEGRVRTETTEAGGANAEPAKSIVIRDPVAGATYRLDPARKTAIIMPRISVAAGVVYDGLGEIAAPGNPAPGGRGARGGRGDGASGTNPDPARIQQLADDLQTTVAALQAAKNNPNRIEEDLGIKTVNGVPARGTRITSVVPVGAIGNDKEFHSVTERWFSPDLNLLIKSVSADPRFGTTTYELTNINRQAPDPSLFQVPANYSIVSQNGRAPQAAVQAQNQSAAPARPQFEVASIKPCKEGERAAAGSGTRGSEQPSGRLDVNCAPVKQLILMAYRDYANGQWNFVMPFGNRIEGPDWIDSERYRINAKADGPATPGMMRGPMLQALLEDRFQVKVHRETRQLPVYALTVAKGGLKVPRTPEGGCTPRDLTQISVAPGSGEKHTCGTIGGRGNSRRSTIEGFGITMTQVAQRLGGRAGRPVIDKTGIDGMFDFYMEFAVEGAAPADEPAPPSFFTALGELGLKLEPAKGPVEFLVIDHAARPSEN